MLRIHRKRGPYPSHGRTTLLPLQLLRGRGLREELFVCALGATGSAPLGALGGERMSLRETRLMAFAPGLAGCGLGLWSHAVKDIGSKDHGLIFRLPTRRAQSQQWAGPCFRRPAVGLARVPPLAGLGCGRLEGCR